MCALMQVIIKNAQYTQTTAEYNKNPVYIIWDLLHNTLYRYPHGVSRKPNVPPINQWHFSFGAATQPKVKIESLSYVNIKIMFIYL